MKYEDLKPLSYAELLKKAYQIKKDTFSIRFQSATDASINKNKLGFLRKDYAQILTRLNELVKERKKG